jgi:hypothetical protein
MNTQNEDRAHPAFHFPEPFPQPQTIPSGWDLSGLVLEPQPSTVEEPGPGRELETDSG